MHVSPTGRQLSGLSLIYEQLGWRRHALALLAPHLAVDANLRLALCTPAWQRLRCTIVAHTRNHTSRGVCRAPGRAGELHAVSVCPQLGGAHHRAIGRGCQPDAAGDGCLPGNRLLRCCGTACCRCLARARSHSQCLSRSPRCLPTWRWSHRGSYNCRRQSSKGSHSCRLRIPRCSSQRRRVGLSSSLTSGF